MHLSLDVMVFHFAPVHFVVCDRLSPSCFETVISEDFLKLWQREKPGHILDPNPALTPSVMLLHVEKSNPCRYY